MKNTKNFLIVVASAIISYLFVSFAVYLLSDMTFKDSCTSGITFFVSLLFGGAVVFHVMLDLLEQ